MGVSDIDYGPLAALIGNWGIRVPAAIIIGGVLELDVVWIWVTLIFDHIARAAYLGVSFVRGRWRNRELVLPGSRETKSS